MVTVEVNGRRSGDSRISWIWRNLSPKLRNSKRRGQIPRLWGRGECGEGGEARAVEGSEGDAAVGVAAYQATKTVALHLQGLVGSRLLTLVR